MRSLCLRLGGISAVVAALYAQGSPLLDEGVRESATGIPMKGIWELRTEIPVNTKRIGCSV
jgi:hypothetical protein